MNTMSHKLNVILKNVSFRKKKIRQSVLNEPK